MTVLTDRRIQPIIIDVLISVICSNFFKLTAILYGKPAIVRNMSWSYEINITWGMSGTTMTCIFDLQFWT